MLNLGLWLGLGLGLGFRVRLVPTETMVPPLSSSGRRRRTKGVIWWFAFLFSLVTTWRYALSFGSCNRPMLRCLDVRKLHFSSWMQQPRGCEDGGFLGLMKSSESRMR